MRRLSAHPSTPSEPPPLPLGQSRRHVLGVGLPRLRGPSGNDRLQRPWRQGQSDGSVLLLVWLLELRGCAGVSASSTLQPRATATTPDTPVKLALPSRSTQEGRALQGPGVDGNTGGGPPTLPSRQTQEKRVGRAPRVGLDAPAPPGRTRGGAFRAPGPAPGPNGQAAGRLRALNERVVVPLGLNLPAGGGVSLSGGCCGSPAKSLQERELPRRARRRRPPRKAAEGLLQGELAASPGRAHPSRTHPWARSAALLPPDRFASCAVWPLTGCHHASIDGEARVGTDGDGVDDVLAVGPPSGLDGGGEGEAGSRSAALRPPCCGGPAVAKTAFGTDRGRGACGGAPGGGGGGGTDRRGGGGASSWGDPSSTWGATTGPAGGASSLASRRSAGVALGVGGASSPWALGDRERTPREDPGRPEPPSGWLLD